MFALARALHSRGREAPRAPTATRLWMATFLVVPRHFERVLRSGCIYKIQAVPTDRAKRARKRPTNLSGGTNAHTTYPLPQNPQEERHNRRSLLTATLSRSILICLAPRDLFYRQISSGSYRTATAHSFAVVRPWTTPHVPSRRLLVIVSIPALQSSRSTIESACSG